MAYSKAKPFVKVDVTPELKNKMDEFSSQLAQKAQQSDLEKTNNEVDKKAYQNEVNSIRTKIDNIIVTPAEGISEQEIITARVDEHGSEFHSLSSRLNALQKEATKGILEFTLNDWEIGGIDASTGENADIPRRIRTSGYHSFKDEVRVVIDEGYRIIVYAYDYNETTGEYTFNNNLGGYQTGEITLNNDYDAYRIMIDTLVDVVDTQLSYVITLERDLGIFETEKALKKEIESTHTDIYGYEYPTLSDRLTSMHRELSEGVIQRFLTDWELGGISASTGESTDAPARIRTGYHSFPHDTKMIVKEGYRFLVVGFSHNVETGVYTQERTYGYIYDELTLKGNQHDAYRIMIDTLVDVDDTELSNVLTIEETRNKTPEITIDKYTNFGFKELCDIDSHETSVTKEADVITFNCVPTTTEFTKHVEVIKAVEFGGVLQFDIEGKSDDYNEDDYLTIGGGITVEWLDENMQVFEPPNMFVNPSEEIKYYITTSSRYGYHRFRYAIPRYASYARIIVFTNGGNPLRIRSFNARVVSPELTTKDKPYRFYAHLKIGNAPDNTHSAFDLIASSGMNGTVLNCNLTSDGEIVVIHDDNIYQSTGVDAMIYDLTYAEASQYNYARWHTTTYPFEMLPRMEEVLAFLSISGVEPYIRLADTWLDDSQGAYTKLFALLKKYNLLGKTTVKGAKEQLDACYSVLGKNVRYGWIVNIRRTDEELNTFLTEYGEGNVFLDIKIDAITKEYVEYCKSIGLPVSCWFVNDNVTAQKLAKWGVSEFCTDYLCDPIMPLF